MDPIVYRIPRAHEIESMLDSAGIEIVSHVAGDESAHFAHWFVAEPP